MEQFCQGSAQSPPSLWSVKFRLLIAACGYLGVGSFSLYCESQFLLSSVSGNFLLNTGHCEVCAVEIRHRYTLVKMFCLSRC